MHGSEDAAVGRHGRGRRHGGLPVGVWVAITLVWLAVIWGHSLVAGDVSSRESLGVVEVLRPLFEAAGVHATRQMTFIVRKTAHFSEYAVLAIVLVRLRAAARRSHGTRGGELDRAGVRLVVASVCLGCLAPVADETIQLFVAGRSGQLTDVLIDLSGLLAGTLLSGLASYVSNGRQKLQK